MHTHVKEVCKKLKFLEFVEMKVVRVLLVRTHEFDRASSTAEASDTENGKVGGEGG